MIQLETICALSTPQGIGAIGVIRVSGERTFEIVNKIFKGKDLTKVDSHTIHFGTIRDGGVIVDEVLIAVFKTPRSFTKEDVVEISCHGSDYIIRYILKLLLQNGCRMAQAGEFTQRAFLNGQFDLVQAEAVADLIAADSEAAHKTAMNLMRGGFSNQLKVLREELIHFASLVELELDFGEEDVEFAERDDLKFLILKIQNYLKILIDSFDAGNVIKEGIPVAIIGPPNAGKSTLLNVLLNEEKAIVTEIAGTTRDVIEDVLFIEGIKFRFIDTAGIRATKDVVESIGIQRSKDAMRRAEIVLLLTDNQVINDDFVLDFEEEKIIKVRNKIDLFDARQDTEASVTSPQPLSFEERGILSPEATNASGEENTFLQPTIKSPFRKISTELQKKARDLRKSATNAETFLWELLRNHQLDNKKIRRQHPLEEGFILDFYCHECRLGIELDGKYHDGSIQLRYDDFRTREIESIYQIKIIRFTNDEVLNEMDRVLEEISLNLITSPPTPLLQGKRSVNIKPLSYKERGWGEVYTNISQLNISAKNNIGIDELKAAIVAKAKVKKQADTMLTNLRHYEHLVKANEALSEVLQGLDIGITGDFLAQDIRLSLHHLGEITGSITSEDLLANIFSKFCIGK